MSSLLRSLRRLLLCALVVLAVTQLWRTGSHVEKVPGRILGGSMAPAFSGTPCFHVTCADCGFPFACDAEHPPYRDLAVCPNCGFAENEVSPDARQAGEQVKIERGSFATRPPQRWEVAAIRSPDDEQTYNVKRAIGLPGETISIREGDLYANGQLLRKSLSELKQLAVPVNDDRYRPSKTAGLPPRWQGEEGAKGWRTAEGGYIFDPGLSRDRQWLVYRNWACMANPLARTRESPVLDNDSYNQSASRELLEVRDLLVVCRVQAHGRGSVGLALHDGQSWFHISIALESGVVVLQREEVELARTRFSPQALAREAQLEFALCDQQVLLAIDGGLVFQVPYELAHVPGRHLGTPARVSARAAHVKVANLQIWRDVHYLDPTGLGRPWNAQFRLATDEYFVLGDNGPISIDSRFWKPGSVTRKTLLGRILRPAGS